MLGKDWNLDGSHQGIFGYRDHTRAKTYGDSKSSPLNTEIKCTLQNWNKLGLSLLGKINDIGSKNQLSYLSFNS